MGGKFNPGKAIEIQEKVFSAEIYEKRHPCSLSCLLWPRWSLLLTS